MSDDRCTLPTPPLYCDNHPNRETSLRCNRCERPSAATCAVLTPTGYRCKECVRGSRKVFETARWMRLSRWPSSSPGCCPFLGSLVGRMMGFFTIFIAPIAGVIIAEAVRWAVKRRSPSLLFQLGSRGAAAGGLRCSLDLLHPADRYLGCAPDAAGADLDCGLAGRVYVLWSPAPSITA